MSRALDKMRLRLDYLGGVTQQDRMIANKLKSFKGALTKSYQAADIIKLSDGSGYTCLINPDRVKPDYDNKIISIDNSAEMRAGETFYWPANNTYWLIYLSELTESAYYRGYVRRCKYKLIINDNDYYVYIQGPTETDIKWNQKAGITWSKLNSSLTMYITKTEESLEYLKRFSKIQLMGNTWEVEAIDSISMEGIIEVNLGEFFNNSLEDLQPDLVVEEIDTSLPHILGDVFVKPYDIKTYNAVLTSGGTWSINNDNARVVSSTDTQAIVEVVSGRSGIFTLSYSGGSTDISLAITIESL